MIDSEKFNYFVDKYTYDPLSGNVLSIKTGKIIKSKKNGYIIIQSNIGGKVKRVLAHRYIMWLLGYDIDGYDVDHINGIRDDNRLVNLRIVDRSVNLRNCAKRVDNSSGLCGISWHKHKNKWEIKILKKTIGFTSDFFEACCIRKSEENNIGSFTLRHGIVDSEYHNPN